MEATYKVYETRDASRRYVDTIKTDEAWKAVEIAYTRNAQLIEHGLVKAHMIAEKVNWNPRPRHTDSIQTYSTGYSDGFYGYRYGSGMQNPNGLYKRAYNEGAADNGKQQVQ